MIENWPETARMLSGWLRDLRGGTPDVMKAFSGMAQSALAPKALDTKTKELIALAISVAVRCDDCIAFHAKAAVDHGATEEEVAETLGMAIYMGAGPSVMYASHAMQAFKGFAAVKAAKSTDTEALIAAMEGLSFETPKGVMTFRKEDHQAVQEMYHFKVKAGATGNDLLELVRVIPASELPIPIRNKR